MRRIRILYHHEEGVWWAESPDLPGYSAAADTFDEVRDLVWEGAPEACEEACFIEEVGVPLEASQLNTAEPAEGTFTTGGQYHPSREPTVDIQQEGFYTSPERQRPAAAGHN